MTDRLPKDLAGHLAARLAHPLPGATAHAAFSPRMRRHKPLDRRAPDDAKQAAALILLYPSTDGPAFALTVRKSDLPHHPGQISLPGGRLDPGETHEAAAMREAQEEIGVDPQQLRILGALTPLYVNVSRFVITPFVAISDARPRFGINEREVAELVEVPLAELIDSARLKWATSREFGIPFRPPAATEQTPELLIPYFQLSAHPNHRVWGATAMILGEFARLIDDTFGPGGIDDGL